MSSHHAKNDKEPELDPYAVLGVPHTASDADINKAFKRLALKLHPDKQQQQQQQQQDGKSGNKKREEPEATAEEAFHQVQWAKSFLLDAEFADQRRRLDAQRASRQARRVVDETRSASMSDKRRRMRDELQRQEQQASHHLKYKRNNEATATSATASSTHEGSSSSSKKPAKRVDGKRGQKSTTSTTTTTTAEEAIKLERLRRQGNEMREAYADRQEEQMAANAAKSRRREQQQQYDYVDEYDDDEQRQVRLKWSRKKLTGTSSTTTSSSSSGGALTESTLMQILKRRVEFGDIERIEMLGHKGNAALVTFVSADSCRPCVDALLDSEEMRATFVGKRKEREEEEEEEELDKADGKKEQERRLFSLQNRDAESVADWKLRRAAEREELLRQVERDEDTAASGTKTHADSKNNNSSSTGIGQKRKSTAAIFPPFLPNNDDNNSATMAHLSPFERLQQAEVEILEKSGILSKQEMRALQAAVAL